MIAHIDQHKDRFGVEPICAQLPIALPPTLYVLKSPHVMPSDHFAGLGKSSRSVTIWLTRQVREDRSSGLRAR
jgi:hypothetical protein